MWRCLIATIELQMYHMCGREETERLKIKSVQAALSETINDREETFTHQRFTAVHWGGSLNEKVMKVLIFMLCKLINILHTQR